MGHSECADRYDPLIDLPVTNNDGAACYDNHYNNILRHDESVDNSQGSKLHAFADAIQSDNKPPNYDSDLPWDNTLPVQTGDDNNISYWFTLMLCMLLIILTNSRNRKG